MKALTVVSAVWLLSSAVFWSNAQGCFFQPFCLVDLFGFCSSGSGDAPQASEALAVPGPCDSSPCLNGGTCENDGEGYVCTCPRFVLGSRCQGCAEGWITSTFSSTPNACYLLVGKRLHTYAESFCQKQIADEVAMITSDKTQEEHDLITSPELGASKSFHLSGEKIDGVFVWPDDGTAIASTPFDKWASNEPDGKYPGANDNSVNCMAMTKEGFWQDMSCNTGKLFVICKYFPS